MKRTFLITIIIALLFSCKKEVNPPANDDLQFAVYRKSIEKLLSPTLQKLAIMRDAPERSVYAVDLTNACYPEAVGLLGTMISTQQSFERNGTLYNTHTMRYEQVTGPGFTSGLEYKGRGQYMDIAKIFPDRSAVETVSFVAVYGTSNGDSIIIDEHSQFSFSPDGTMTIDYNRIDHRCK